MQIGQPFGHTGRVNYQYGHAFYHYRVINGTVYRVGVFTHHIDGRQEVTIDREGCPR